MNLLSINLVDSILFRLFMQIITFLMAALVTHMVWNEYRRTGSTFQKYIFSSFLCLFLQSAFMLCTFIWSQSTGKELPEAIMPMVDHLLKIGGIILFVQAFIAASPSFRIIRHQFLDVNFSLLAITTPFFWYFWLRYVEGALPLHGKFSFFWLDLVYESWVFVLLVFGIYCAWRANVGMKRAFLVAFVLLIGKELLHIVNIILANNTISLITLLDRLLLIPYFYMIIVATHQAIIEEIARANTSKESYRDSIYESAIQALAGSLEIKDPYTQGHADRVTIYSLEIGRRLNLSEEDLRTLYLGAILHDIGKIGIHEDILRKPCELSETEWAQIRKHPESGAEIVGRVDALRHKIPAVLFHHEGWDGRGYPMGLKGEEIPLHARIVAIADAYDAMTSDRPYRRALDHEAAIKELELGRDTQFDSRLVDAFMEFLEESNDLHESPPKGASSRLTAALSSA